MPSATIPVKIWLVEFAMASPLARWLGAAALVMAFSAAGGADATEGGVRANVVAFGLFGDQNVFQSEAAKAAAIVAARYGHGDAMIVRANVGARRAAMIADLRAALADVANRPGGAQDVLILILSSHGSQVGLAVKSGPVTETLSPQDLRTMLATSGIEQKVIIVSACFSGVFAEALADSRTAVITAADDSHASFGCRSGAEWTYFGKAFFADALPRAKSLREAFLTARSLVGQEEAAERLTPSNPQMAGGQAVLARLDGLAPPAPPPPDAPAASSCIIEIEPSPQVAGCNVFNGYTHGALIGAFHLNGPRYVAAGGKCPSDYLPGRQISANKIAVDGAVFTMSGDCRHAARSTQ
jgi:Peptidase C13 family